MATTTEGRLIIARVRRARLLARIDQLLLKARLMGIGRPPVVLVDRLCACGAADLFERVDGSGHTYCASCGEVD